MWRLFLLTVMMSPFLPENTTAQSRVANFYTGKYGTTAYEHFSFWTKDNKRAQIEYSYGVRPKVIELVYLGLDTLNGKNSFKVRFPNKYILYITPKGSKLLIEDKKGKYTKTFTWEYEGPVNGVGTYCAICADANESMEMVMKYYLQ